MSLISLIPIRANGTEILAGWFNTIRSALLSFFGTEATEQTSFSGAASQTGTNLTGLVLDSSITRRGKIAYTIVTATKVESGDFVILYDGTNWAKFDGAFQGVDSGVTTDVAAGTGQVEYDSGGETFVFQYKVETFNI